MASSYPGALDAFTNPVATDTLDNPSHSDQHTNINDAMEAVQAELGTDPAGTEATVKARLKRIEDVAGTNARFVRATSNQTTSHLVSTDVIYNSVAWENDPLSLISLDTLTGVVSLAAGEWEVFAYVRWAASAAGARRQITLVASAGSNNSIQANQAPVSVQTIHGISGIVKHTSAFNIRAQAVQDSGGNLDIEANAATFIAVRLIRTL